MLAENTLAFCKQRTCPDDLTPATDRANDLAVATRWKIAAHVAGCDFCGAEAQLLRQKGFLLVNEATPPPLPFALLVLAKSLLPESAFTVQQHAAQVEHLSLIQA